MRKALGYLRRCRLFSFSAPKIITTGQGGALVTDNDDLHHKIRMIKDFGCEKGGVDHHLIKGWNFKFTDLQAIIGIEQMKKLEWRVERKKELGLIYEELLSGITGVETIATNYEETAPWFFDALVEKRDELIGYLKQNNIGTREFYPPLHSQPAYGYQLSFPVTKEITGKRIWLPSASFLSDQEIEHICTKIRSFYIHYKPS